MTKMEDEEMAGAETKVAVPATLHNKEGAGVAKFPEMSPPVLKIDPDVSMSCSGCRNQIADKFYMKVDGRSWHEKCVSCGNCQRPLNSSCFSKNRKLYCTECYRQLQYCYQCSGSISGEELVMRIGADSYHVTCFVCDYCNKQLQRGDQFHSLQDATKRKICCKKCYDMDDVGNLKVTGSDSEESLNDSDVFPPGVFAPNMFMTSPGQTFNRQMSDFNPGPPPAHFQGVGMPHGKNGKSPSSTSLMTSSDSKRTKRPRTILTTAQRRKFKASFETSQKPCRKVRETLASETGLTPRVVQVWFQNQRAKMKKIARRQNQGESGTRRKRKKDVDSDSENEVPSSPGSYTSAPTPHQTQYYTDYQSPRSVQSTPTKDENVQRVFSPTYLQHGFNHSDIHYEEYGPLSHALSDPSFLQPPSTPSHSPSHLEMHQMLHERIGGMQAHEHLSNTQRDVMLHHDDVTGPSTMPFHAGEPMQGMYAPQRHPEVIDISNERPLGGAPNPAAVNPIDSLMYMQSNFFST